MWFQDNILRLIFLILLMSKKVSSKEPQCSSFHYEEQLLSKMIRMEIAMEQQQQRVNDALEKMSQTVELFKTETIEKENQMLDRIRDALESADATMVNFSNRTLLLEDKLKNAVEEKAGTPTITFEAKVLKDLSVLSNTKLVFTEAVFNHGNGYNVIAGVFTCPLNGTYLFTSHLCSYGSKPFGYSLVVDDTVLTSGYVYGSGSNHCTSFDAIAILQVASRVWVQTNGYTSNFYQDSNMVNTFSGVLLHR